MGGLRFLIRADRSGRAGGRAPDRRAGRRMAHGPCRRSSTVPATPGPPPADDRLRTRRPRHAGRRAARRRPPQAEPGGPRREGARRRSPSCAEIARATGARRLLIAIPTAPGDVIRRAVEDATALGLETRTVPALEDLVSGRVGLRRDPRGPRRRPPAARPRRDRRAGPARPRARADRAGDRRGGSIGSELARQVFDLDPATLVLLDRAEGPLYDIERELTLLAERDSARPPAAAVRGRDARDPPGERGVARRRCARSSPRTGR